MIKPMLLPAAVLVIWSLGVLSFMARRRFAALRHAGIRLEQRPAGQRGQDMEGKVPPAAQWPAHNYAHLMEQPTLFYATCGILALAGAGWLDVALGWAYVGLRVVHSLWQIRVNTIPVRLRLFSAATFVLMALAARAFWACLY